MDEINEKIIKALKENVEIQAEMISKLKAINKDETSSYEEKIKEQKETIGFLRSELRNILIQIS